MLKVDIRNYFFSIVIDFCLLLLFIVALIALSAIVIGLVSKFSVGFDNFSNSREDMFVLLAVLLVIYPYFFIGFKRTGQTLGMKFLKLKVIQGNRSKLSFLTVLIWAIHLVFPILALISAFFLIVPPYETWIEKITSTRIAQQ